MGELREEIRMKKQLRMKVAGSRPRWAGLTRRMSEHGRQKRLINGEEEDRN